MSEERRLSTPLVLAAASTMLAIAFVVWMGMGSESEEEPAPLQGPLEIHMDDSTPESAAESFYDAWRRRRWPEAMELSRDEALAAAREKQAADEAMPSEERIIAERSWDALAHAPLTLALEEVEMLGDEHYRLSGVAEYDFVGTPYRRRVSFDVEGTQNGYRVTEMRLGDVLSDLPAIFQGAAP